MQNQDIALLIVFLLTLGLSAPALGAWMAKVFSGEPHLPLLKQEGGRARSR